MSDSRIHFPKPSTIAKAVGAGVVGASAIAGVAVPAAAAPAAAPTPPVASQMYEDAYTGPSEAQRAVQSLVDEVVDAYYNYDSVDVLAKNAGNTLHNGQTEASLEPLQDMVKDYRQAFKANPTAANEQYGARLKQAVEGREAELAKQAVSELDAYIAIAPAEQKADLQVIRDALASGDLGQLDSDQAFEAMDRLQDLTDEPLMTGKEVAIGLGVAAGAAAIILVFDLLACKVGLIGDDPRGLYVAE